MFFLISIIIGFFSFIEYHLNHLFKFRVIILLIVGIFFFILFGFNTNSPDLENYKLHYYNFDQDFVIKKVEPLILLLMKSCNYFGLSFQSYQLIFAGLTLTPFIYTIFKFSPFPIFVLFNFYFIPFFPDITQIRFFLAFAIFMFSLLYFQKNKRIYYLLLITAILCHFSMLILVLFSLVRNRKFFTNQLYWNIIIFVFCAIVLLLPKYLINNVIFLVTNNYSSYLESSSQSQSGTLLLFLPFFIVNNIIIISHKKISIRLELFFNKKYYEIINLFVELIKFSNFIIVFQLIVRDFSRINYNLYILVIIYFSIIIYYYKKKSKLISGVTIFFVIIFNLILYYIQFFMLNNFQYFKIINDTFTSNSLF